MRPAIQIILLCVLIAIALAWGYWTGVVRAGVTQPIAFPHKTHAGTLGLPCTTCHQRADKDTVAGRPPTALCLGCHMGGDTKSDEIKKIRAYGEKGTEIPWKRVWRLPSHVFFPHSVHVTAAGIQCQSCHGPMETLTGPPARPLKRLAMNDCIGCHQAQRLAQQKNTAQPMKVAMERSPNDCVTCHR
ncbi:MAG TPA: cytochrome c3 family protein [Verrucomicrobiae bacterium]|nr:cytochrome c3 family protein [Verrucomicrobiae bacterium]